jgi:hypothetical protein
MTTFSSCRLASARASSRSRHGRCRKARRCRAWPAPDNPSASRSIAKSWSIAENVISAASHPAAGATRLRARVFWLHRRPLAVGGRITARIGTAEAGGVVAAIENAVDPGLLTSDGAEVIGPNHVGDIDIDLSRTLATDSHTDNPNTGRVVLEFEGRIAGGGLILSTQAAAANPAYGPRPNRSAAVAAPVPCAHTTPQQLSAKAAALARLFARLSPAERLVRLRREVAGKIVFTTSFGLEDQVILHLLSQQGERHRGVDTRYRPVVSRNLRAVGTDRTPLWPAHQGSLSKTRRPRGAHRAPRDQQILSFARGARSLLRCAQGRTPRARPCGRAGLDHGAARRAIRVPAGTWRWPPPMPSAD